jgi:Icc-related predicted phosphoesterase
MGGIEPAAVGSTAVREAIERHQPVLSLHGHVHESRGTAKIGRTLAINPGSEYNQGLLRGAIVQLNKGKVKMHQLTAG